MLEYYFSKGFDILEYNVNNLEKLPNEVKQGIMQILYSSYIQTEFSDTK